MDNRFVKITKENNVNQKDQMALGFQEMCMILPSRILKRIEFMSSIKSYGANVHSF